MNPNFKSQLWRDLIVYHRLRRVLEAPATGGDIFDYIDLSSDIYFLFDQSAGKPLQSAWDSRFSRPLTVPYLLQDQNDHQKSSDVKRTHVRVNLCAVHMGFDVCEIDIKKTGDFVTAVYSSLGSYKRSIVNCPLTLTSLRLSHYLSATMVSINGSSVGVHDVVKYLSNKAGGRHIDLTRKESENRYKILDDVNNIFSGAHASMKTKHGESHPISIVLSYGVLSCLGAIAQHLFWSADVRVLYDQFVSEFAQQGLNASKSPWALAEARWPYNPS